MDLEVGDGHLTRQQEGDRPGEEADQEKRAADELQHAGDPRLRGQGDRLAAGKNGDGEPDEFAAPACMNMNAATIRSTLRSSGERSAHFSETLFLLMPGGAWISDATDATSEDSMPVRSCVARPISW